MNAGDVLKRAGVVTGVAAGVLGAAYGAERAVVARMRHGDDPDADSPLVPTFDTEIDIDTHDHGVLHVISRGEGPPILFAHGVTLSSRVWAKQFDSVPAAGFRAIAFDARGHGASNVGESGHSVDNLADDVRSVLEALDLHDAILVGHSMGGMAIQAFVIRHPHIAHERACGMVLMSTAPSMPMSDARRVRGALERMVGASPDVGMLLRQKNLGFLLARVGFGEDPHPSHVEATRQMLAVCSRATLRDSSRALLALDLTGGLPNVTMPTLVLGGTRDAITPLRQSREIAELVPNARLEEFEGAGHMLMYERADDVDKLIIEFAGGVPRVITDVPGVEVGHWTGTGTGVTVVVVPPATTASCEVRGGAPASRETALLEPGRIVEHVDAIVLSGGSAFGLATADGIMHALAERGRGYPTRGGPVPIVPAAAIFDLVSSDGERPGPEEGRAALAAAGTGPFALGRAGAGRGATIGKWRGGEYAVSGGLGSASARDGDVVIGALAVVNAVGDVIGADGVVIAGSTAPDGTPGFGDPLPFEEGEHTTLIVVATNARLTKVECKLVAESAHHGMARAIHPSHSRHDGDIAFALATGQVDAHVDRLRMIASDVTAEAIRAAVL